MPSIDMLRWAAIAIESSGQAVVSADLSQSGDGGPWLLNIGYGGSTVRAVLRLDDPKDISAVRRFSTEASATYVATQHELAAPSLLASDLDGSVTGHLAILQTALPGSSRIPIKPDGLRLRALGRALAAVHGVAASPTAALPTRLRPLDGVDFGVLPLPEGSAQLLTTARGLLTERTPPGERHTFVHGDFWQGNTLWEDHRHTGTIDWDFAGVGPAGVDLGSARCDVAVIYGHGAEDEVLGGWEEVMGESLPNVGWWDAVAATSTPPDLAMWLPNFHHQGRTDLDLTTVTLRRDSFLAAALQQLR
jgi:aminoglycoside phosphotransferase (APT) family kinase protein